jgi:hypothetical protein
MKEDIEYRHKELDEDLKSEGISIPNVDMSSDVVDLRFLSLILGQ